MGRRGKQPRARLAAPADPNGLTAWARRYIEWLRVHHYAQRTIQGQEYALELFIAWCAARSITMPQDVSKPILDRYQGHVFHERQSRNGRLLGTHAQQLRLVYVKGFFRFLTRQNVIMFNPASELELPRREFRLPKNTLTAEEAEVVMNQPDTGTLAGIRDRAILEVLYSTGIRRSELVGLSLDDVDFGRRVLQVRQGKNRRDRIVPIGERALRWVRKYLDEVRDEFVLEPDDRVLFLLHTGEPITFALTGLVERAVTSAKVGKTGSCHMFRHTAATLMLENGADIRMIQAMLGHQRLTSTQLYTHVAIRKLQEVHARTHPAGLPEPDDNESKVHEPRG